LNVVFFLLGDSPASEFYVPKFRKSVTKRRHVKFRRRGITKRKNTTRKILFALQLANFARRHWQRHSRCNQCLRAGWAGWEAGKNYWSPAVRKVARGPSMLLMFLSFSIVSDVLM